MTPLTCFLALLPRLRATAAPCVLTNSLRASGTSFASSTPVSVISFSTLLACLTPVPQGYGGFVRPDKVKVGDYPPVDEFAEEGLGDDEI